MVHLGQLAHRDRRGLLDIPVYLDPKDFLGSLDCADSLDFLE